ncbi:MAG: MFS transporter [Brevundimonas subvibrioides]|uniref:MFS transporter n=1 Tax=Brevundimonas subvibrioides TaxID=74313 RepID=A0A258HFN6_9CAUL|nr:MFS transporter [Brevundimonas subvibrioides]OYX55569.1 MAG: MFS transporter [Brevundimonas subvibrioides]
MTDAASTRVEPIQIQPPAGKYRWVVVWLLFAAMVINYVDRQALGVLKPTLMDEFGWTEGNYADIVFWFQASYAVSYLLWGRLVDRIGARWGFGLAFIIWQIAFIAHAGIRSLNTAIFARVALGIGEGGGFPAGIKAVTEWFPKKERAFAVGIFNAGTNIGAIITPLIIPFIASIWLGTVAEPNWQMALIIVGVAGFIWVPIWFAVYKRPGEHSRVTPAELNWIAQDAPDPVHKVGWLKLLTVKETWAYALGKFLIDPIWWFFLFWLPGFLQKQYDLNILTFGPPLIAIYLLSDVGSVGGGWLSGQFLKRGMSLGAARKLTMLICALAVTPVAFAGNIDNMWLAVLVIGVATAAHQGFSANLYAMPGDVFPRSAVGSVVGIGGMIGGFGGMAMAKYAGYVLDQIGSYTPIFVVAASAYLIALVIIHLLSPRYEPARV